MSRFQIIVLVILSISIIIAVLIFGGLLPGFKGKRAGRAGEKVVMWGTFDRRLIQPIIQELNDENEQFFKLIYEEKNPNEFEEELLDALAAGRGPDLWIISHDQVFKNKDKIFIVPYQSFKKREFKDSYIDSAEILLNSEGILGFPLVIDPIVLYWNKDLFSSESIPTPPSTWNEFLAHVQKLTKKNQIGNIVQAGTAMGEFVNVRNAKDILSMLVLQTGNKMVDRDSMRVVFDEKSDNLPLSPMESAVIFYNQFSDPSKVSYSWNRSLMNSDDMFVGGTLGMYFGYASEYPYIIKKNPHLNFDVAIVPQIEGSRIKTTFGKLYAIVISKSSQKKQSSLYAVSSLTSGGVSVQIAEALSMAPVRRKILANGHENEIFDIFYKSAVMSRNWLEPDPEEVERIFKDLIESTSTGKLEVSRAVRDAARLIDLLLKEG